MHGFCFRFCRRCLQPFQTSFSESLQNSLLKIACLQRNLSTSTMRSSSVSRFVHNKTIKISEEVAQAMHECKPIVALESTIITHGMPYPDNIKTALEVEDIIRDEGCTPATIGVIDGLVHVGFDNTEMERLASSNSDLMKISRRDFPFVVAKKLSGGTTVSGTMLISHLVEIPIFVTGGIGGVHRGAELTMDVSADLNELGRTPVTVVSAGIKSILDIEKTLEYLETQGVCVATFGRDKDFPAFFAPSSGLKAPFNVDDEIKAAEMIYASHYRLKLSSGILIAVPLSEEYSVRGHEMELAIQTALQEAREKNIHGKEVTPYILKRVNELTHGESLQANIALIKNNATTGSKIAWQLSQLIHNNKEPRKNRRPHIKNDNSKTKKKRPVVIGGSVVDFNTRLKQTELQFNGSTNPGIIQQSFGGVGRNIADCLSRLGADPLFISAIGDDCHTSTFQSYCEHMDLRGVRILTNQFTATYCAVLGSTGQLKLGIGDMDIHQHITSQMICEYEEDIKESSLVILDGNISTVAIETACDISSNYKIPVLFEPTDILKARKPYETSAYRKLTYTSPNINELQMMSTALTDSPITSEDLYSIEDSEIDDVISFCLPHCLQLVKTIPVVLVTLGKHGVLVCSKQTTGDINVQHYTASALSSEDLVSVSGAGDCFISTFVNGVIQHNDLDLCVKAGLHAAEMSLLSTETVPKSITCEEFHSSRIQALNLPCSRLIKV